MPGNPLNDQNWAADVTTQITKLIGDVRDKTTLNAIKAVRAVVYGLFLSIMAAVLVVLLLVFLTRGLQVLLHFAVEWDRAVYISYLVIGGIFCGGGLLLMKRRTL